MTEINAGASPDRETVVAEICTLTATLNAGDEPTVNRIVQTALDHFGNDKAIVRALLFAIFASWRGNDFIKLCASLIGRYQALDPDMTHYDADMLGAIGDVSMVMGQWRPAAFAYRERIRKRSSFILSDFFELARVLYWERELAEASRLITGALEVVANLAGQLRAQGGTRGRVCIPYGHPAVRRAIGEMCQTFGLFVMARRLGWIDGRDAVFVIHGRDQVCNPAMLKYWESQVQVCDTSRIANYEKTKIPSIGDVYLLKDCQNSLWAMTVPGLGGVHRDILWALILEVWQDQKLPPVVTLSPQHQSQGQAILASLGFGESDWFVGFHVRENGWSGDTRQGYNSFRSVNIEDYVPMIRAITERGGWVVRMGDRTMRPLPPMPRVFDYALSPHKSDWMDVFLCASARFFVGSQSGLHLMSKVFGVPLVVTNYLPVIAFPVGPDDIALHQRIVSKPLGRELTVRECFSPPVVNQFSRHFFDDSGLTVINNAPEEIADAAVQMLESLNGSEVYTPDELALWEKHRDQTNFCGHKFRYKIGRLFLRNIRELLE